MQAPLTREAFLKALDSRIVQLPQPERQRVREYYDEIILDGMENGKAEGEIIAGLGELEDIAAKTIAEYMAATPAKKKGKAGKIALWICAAPFLIALGVPLAATAFVLYLCGWILIACFFVVALSLGVAGACALVGTAFILLRGPAAGLMQAGAGLLCCGLCLLAFVGSLALAKQYARFSVYLKNRMSENMRKRGGHNEA